MTLTTKNIKHYVLHSHYKCILYHILQIKVN